MSAKNEKLYDRAMDAIREMFSDQSISRSEAKANLGYLKDEIDMLVDSLGEPDDADEDCADKD